MGSQSDETAFIIKSCLQFQTFLCYAYVMHVHKNEDKKVVEYLRHLGLITDEISAYLYLLEHGPLTVLALSRGLSTGRTKLYPLLEGLSARKLVTIHERHYGTTYQASSLQTLEFLVQSKEADVIALRAQLPSTLHSLEQLQKNSPVTSFITEHHDLDGIKQLYWNRTKATAPYLVLESSLQIKKYVGTPLVTKVTVEGPPFTLIPKQPIEMYIYNNTVALIQKNDTGWYGVEIQNELLANQYRHQYSS